MADGRDVSSKRAATAERLSQATLRVLVRKGIAHTTARDIAAEAGMSLGMTTLAFGSKEELVANALASAVRGWLEPGLEALRSDADAATRTMQAVQAFQASFRDGRELLPVYLEALVSTGRDEPARDAVLALRREVHELLASQVRELQGDGAVPAWADPDAMASLHLAVADGIALAVHVDPDGVDETKVAAHYATLLLAAGAQAGEQQRDARPPAAVARRRRR